MIGANDVGDCGVVNVVVSFVGGANDGVSGCCCVDVVVSFVVGANDVGGVNVVVSFCGWC